MAEALVANSRTMPRYYCHMCNVEINIPNENFTCPLCAGGFIEELPDLVPMVPINASGASTSRTANGSAVPNDRDPIQRLSALMALRGEFARLAENESNPNMLQQGGGQQPMRATVNGPPRPATMRQNIGPNFLIDFLNSLDGHFGNTSMVYLGNIGDYAWGREGIDTIVTQLLNQMETAGPPPLPKEKIKEIPTVQVTQEEVDKKTQCSVCWEDFQKDEIVRKLPCSHIYHEDCIIPWLDLHGTCPICRKSLNNEEDEAGGGTGQDGASGPTQNSNDPRSDNSGGGSASRAGSRSAAAATGGNESAPPTTIQNSALDDLD